MMKQLRNIVTRLATLGAVLLFTVPVYGQFFGGGLKVQGTKVTGYCPVLDVNLVPQWVDCSGVVGGVVLEDEGVSQGSQSTINFVGAGVTAVGGTVTIPGGSAPAGTTGDFQFFDGTNWVGRQIASGPLGLVTVNTGTDPVEVDLDTGAGKVPTKAGTNDWTGPNNFSGATKTLPMKAGLLASRPADCDTGEFYFVTDATAGQNLFACTDGTANTWTLQGGGGSATRTEYRFLETAQCTQSGTPPGTAISLANLPSTAAAVPVCIYESTGGTNNGLAGALNFPKDVNANAYWEVSMPSNWSTAEGLDARIGWVGTTANTLNLDFYIAVGCYNNSSEIASSVSFNALQADTGALGPAVAGYGRIANFTGIPITNCSAGETMRVRLYRDSDNTVASDGYTGDAQVTWVRLAYTVTN